MEHRQVKVEHSLSSFPTELKGHAQALKSLDEVVRCFMRLRDVEGVHYAAKLIWNTGK